MTNLWSFLLQTLHVTAAALLLLLVKAILHDKLSPRWQYGIWAVLGVVLVLPANLLGRHGLFDFPLWVETAKTLAEKGLNSAFSSPYTITKITFPLPLWDGTAPASLTDWLFLAYATGAVILLGRYLLSYLTLRLLLRRGCPLSPENEARLARVAGTYGLPFCRAVELEGLDSAFVCGVFSPVLVLPAGKEADDKVLLHELLHLRHGDVALGWLVCLFRCVHWCNPLLWYVFDRVGNDCESLCDQRVLERLEGEERREYGAILLSMANEKYARAPGTSSAANGGANIARRITAIARFKRYPAGMGLVSVCITIALASACLPRTLAAQPVTSFRFGNNTFAQAVSMASARTVRCTTPAGALDTYAKALMQGNGTYLAMATPVEGHGTLAGSMAAPSDPYDPEYWDYESFDSPLPGTAFDNYYIFNLTEASEDLYTALLVFPMKLLDGIEGDPYAKEGWLWVACLPVRVYNSGEGWVVEPTGRFETVRTDGSVHGYGWIDYGDDDLPAAVTYTGSALGFDLTISRQITHGVDNEITGENNWFFGPSVSFNSLPQPHAQPDKTHEAFHFEGVFTGTEAEKAQIKQVRWIAAPLDGEGTHPELKYHSGNFSSGDGTFGGTMDDLDLLNRDFTLESGGGSGYDGGLDGKPITHPAAYLVELTVTTLPPGEVKYRTETVTVTLYPQKGG